MDGENEERKDSILDPITNLAVELEKLKSELNSIRSINTEKDKQLSNMINANKRLVAELSASKVTPNASSKTDSGQVAYKSFKNALNIKE